MFSLEYPSQYFFESRKLRKGQQGTTEANMHDNDDDIQMLVDEMKELVNHDAVDECDVTSHL